MPAETSRAEVLADLRELRAKRWATSLTPHERNLCMHLVASTTHVLTAAGRDAALTLIATNDDALECYLDLREIFLKSKGVV